MTNLTSPAAAVLMLAAFVTAANAQPASPILNTLEVRRLASSGDPASRARLAAHFSALAEGYTADARRHLSMSHSYIGNPNWSLGPGMTAHCNQLADLNTRSATTLRELAVFYQEAAGTPATPPRDEAGFQNGTGAPEPTKNELNALAAQANTPQEHRVLEEYFVTLAKRYTASANEHVALAQTYRGTKIAQASVMHDHLARLARDAATEASAAAATHKQLATVSR